MVRWGAERGTDRHRERVVQGSVDVKARPFPRGLRFPTGRWARGVSRALSPISPRHGERPIPKGKSPLVYTGSSTLVSVFYPVRFTSRTEPTRSLTVLLFSLPLDSLDAYPAEREMAGADWVLRAYCFVDLNPLGWLTGRRPAPTGGDAYAPIDGMPAPPLEEKNMQ